MYFNLTTRKAQAQDNNFLPDRKKEKIQHIINGINDDKIHHQ